MKRKCVCLYSGGLDSRLIIKIMVNMGIEVVAFHGLHCFEGKESYKQIKLRVEREVKDLGASEVVFRDMTPNIVKLLHKNKYGFGKNLNPCTDCRINTVNTGIAVMREVGADFICSGEVIGQRPKSQQRHTMNAVLNNVEDREAVELLLRPLCAKLFEPTIPEKEGWVDREKLYDWSGRSRTPQFKLAEELQIGDFPDPAGGCLLTDKGFCIKMQDLIDNKENISNDDIELLKVGRHLRTPAGIKIVSARNSEEGDALEESLRDCDTAFITDPLPGAYIVVVDRIDPEAERIAAGLAVHYSKYRTDSSATVLKISKAETTTLEKIPAVDPQSIKEMHLV